MAEAIRDGLRLEAIAADIAGDGDTALELLGINAYDIAVLDRDIPGPSGDEVAESIVASGSGMPILMLTAADRLDDKASGFELGADDYLTKPFELQELVLRLRALDRRRANSRPPYASSPGLRLDPFRREVYRDGPIRRADPQAVRGARDPRRRRWRCHQCRRAARTGVGPERRPVHQRRTHHGLRPAQAPRHALADRHRARGRIPHRRAQPASRAGSRPVDRAPGLSVRLRLTLSYAGFLMVAEFVLLAAVWVFLLRYVPNVVPASRSHDAAVRCSSWPSRDDLVRAFVPKAAWALVFLLAFGLLGGWFLAGRMLAPLSRITNATRRAAKGSLSHRIELEGRRDEFRELADSFDTMLAQLEAQVAGQRRFAANASHELRTPLAITQTLLDVARNDPNRDTGELDERLRAVNTRAIELTEALLVLSRADQRSFAREPRRPVTPRGGGHRDTPPLRREARRHRQHLRRRHAYPRLARPPAADDHEPPAQRHRPQPPGTRHGAGQHRHPPRGRDPHGREHRRPGSHRRWSRPSPNRSTAEPNASAATMRVSASAWPSSRASPRLTTELSPSAPGGRGALCPGAAARRPTARLTG